MNEFYFYKPRFVSSIFVICNYRACASADKNGSFALLLFTA